MSIEEGTGDLFAQPDLRALAHGCNCAGAMGKGIAVPFKQRWPRMYEEYRARWRARPRPWASPGWACRASGRASGASRGMTCGRRRAGDRGHRAHAGGGVAAAGVMASPAGYSTRCAETVTS